MRKEAEAAECATRGTEGKEHIGRPIVEVRPDCKETRINQARKGTLFEEHSFRVEVLKNECPPNLHRLLRSKPTVFVVLSVDVLEDLEVVATLVAAVAYGGDILPFLMQSSGQAAVLPVVNAQSIEVSAQCPLMATMELGSAPRLTMPQPCRWSGLSVWLARPCRRSFTCAGVRFGMAPTMRAAMPATCGAAYAVPVLDTPAHWLVVIWSGATTSGFRTPCWVGPQPL